MQNNTDINVEQDSLQIILTLDDCPNLTHLRLWHLPRIMQNNTDINIEQDSFQSIQKANTML
jgi:hypothetical protein